MSGEAFDNPNTDPTAFAPGCKIYMIVDSKGFTMQVVAPPGVELVPPFMILEAEKPPAEPLIKLVS